MFMDGSGSFGQRRYLSRQLSPSFLRWPTGRLTVRIGARARHLAVAPAQTFFMTMRDQILDFPLTVTDGGVSLGGLVNMDGLLAWDRTDLM